jgi:hypothetical protein
MYKYLNYYETQIHLLCFNMFLDFSRNFSIEGMSSLLTEQFKSAFKSEEIKRFILDIKCASKKYGMTLDSLSDELGEGVTCTKGMPKGKRFAAYCGEYRPIDSGLDTDNQDYVFEVERKSRKYPGGIEIDGFNSTKKPWNLSYLNHSCKNFNACFVRVYVKGVPIIVAESTREIEPGEQMLVNYNGLPGEEGFWTLLKSLKSKYHTGKIPDGKRIQKCMCNLPGKCPYKFARLIFSSTSESTSRQLGLSVGHRPEISHPVAALGPQSPLLAVTEPIASQPLSSASQPSESTNATNPSLKRKRETANRAGDAWKELIPRRIVSKLGDSASRVEKVGAVGSMLIEQVPDTTMVGVETDSGSSLMVDLSTNLQGEADDCQPVCGKIQCNITRFQHKYVGARKNFLRSGYITIQAKKKLTAQSEFLRRFPEIKLPWHGKICKGFDRRGSVSKMIWMRLYTLHRENIIEVDIGEGGLYGITGFTIPEENLDAFNSGPFPCTTTLRGQAKGFARESPERLFLYREYYKVLRAWKTTGFTEQKWDLSVEFSHSDKTQSSIRKYFNTARNRRKVMLFNDSDISAIQILRDIDSNHLIESQSNESDQQKVSEPIDSTTLVLQDATHLSYPNDSLDTLAMHASETLPSNRQIPATASIPSNESEKTVKGNGAQVLVLPRAPYLSFPETHAFGTGSMISSYVPMPTSTFNRMLHAAPGIHHEMFHQQGSVTSSSVPVMQQGSKSVMQCGPVIQRNLVIQQCPAIGHSESIADPVNPIAADSDSIQIDEGGLDGHVSESHGNETSQKRARRVSVKHAKDCMKVHYGELEIKLKEFSENFPSVVLPWLDPDLSKMKSTSRMLWMRLYSMIQDKTIIGDVGIGGFGGISRFVVPIENMERFNQGPFPCLTYISRQKRKHIAKSEEHDKWCREYKRMNRIWGICGFKDVCTHESVTFTYHSEQVEKFKRFFKKKSKVESHSSQQDAASDGGISQNAESESVLP